MNPPTDPITIESILSDGSERRLADDVLDGLTHPYKELPPKHFYDARGSELFERICKLPEYYPTRTEIAILDAHAADIAERTGAVDLVELGSGSATKARILLRAMQAAGNLKRYVPLDCSESALLSAAEELCEEFPGLRVHGVVCDFERHLASVPASEGPRLVAFLGGTIGNFPPGSRRRLLRDLAGMLGPEDHLLLGTDLVKDPEVIEAAYDDGQGVTAEFNLNVLHVINRELHADFDPADFTHVAVFDREHEWIEMRLRAVRDCQVTISDLDLVIDFDAGEEVRTEISCKFTQRRLVSDLAAAGLSLRNWAEDPDGLFALTLAGSVQPAS